MATNPFPTHTDTGIYKNITVIKLGIFYYLFSVSHENQQRNHYKIISWKDLSLPTEHNMSDCLEEKQDQATYLEIPLSTKERITQRKSWQQFLQIMNLHNNLGPNKQKAHGNWDLTEEQTFLNSSDAFSARLRATAANQSDGAAKLKLVLLLRGKLAPTLLHTKFTPKSHKSKSNFKPDGKVGKGEWRNPRILNSSKQAFPRPPETEQQRMRGYPDISDVLPFKLFLVVKNPGPSWRNISTCPFSSPLYSSCNRDIDDLWP